MNFKSNKLSIHNLLTSLIARAPINDLKITPSELSSRSAMTIRAEEQLKKFYEIQASNLGVSLHDFIVMTLRSVMHASMPAVNTQIDICAERFLELFKVHKIPFVDIPNFFDPGCLSLKDLKSTDVLIDKLSTDLLTSTSNLFSIDIDWLKGVSDRATSNFPHQEHWYKGPEYFIKRVFDHQKMNKKVDVFLATSESTSRKIKTGSYNSFNSGFDEEMFVAPFLCIHDAKLNYTYYELYNKERWNYEPVRILLKALAKLLNLNGLSLGHADIPDEVFAAMHSGSMIPAEVLSRYRHKNQIDFNDFFETNPQFNPETDELPYVDELYNQKKEIWNKFVK